MQQRALRSSQERSAQLCQCLQPPLHLLGFGSVTGPDAGFQLIEARRLALDEAIAFLTLALSQCSQEGGLGID